MTIPKESWWKDSVVYQVWPASFKDSNGDGIGDIPGLISKLDHIKEIGADVVWLSPHYESPMDDMGYDISNYNAIYEKFGTMDDMDKLIEEIHKRDMKLILDLVINHTSSEHAWFKESRSSKDNSKRDWYIWKDERNNWMSHFSGSAWEYDETTGQYYLRQFARTQPDLNWENPETRQAIYDSALDYWFKKGVNGFRIDTAGMYSKVQSFPDAPIVFPDSKWQPAGALSNSGPRIHEFHKEMYEKVTSKYDAMTVGEVGHCSKEDALKYVSAKEKEMNMMFLFDTVDVGSNKGDRFRYDGWTLKDFKDAIQNQCSFIIDDETGERNDAWSTVFIENHDQPRCVTRFGNTSTEELRNRSAKMLALLQVSLTGTLFIYQGQEIGMTNVPRSWDIREYLDINTINYWAAFNEKDHTEEEKTKLLDIINLLARDNARTPVQWDSSANGGFTTGKPWMKVNDNYPDINVESQKNDPDSVLSFYKRAIGVRKQYRDLMVDGDFEIVDYHNDKVFRFTKSKGTKKIDVILNFSNEEQDVDYDGEVILSNMQGFEGKLAPYEAKLVLVSD
ncbi:AGL1 [Cyberlindnera jadinii]|uniref:AGL1 protein n=1 Tax=Cyberlindnera jadinii (strain ATCC 18201 / CBS 1600 / BCRC 20928 / JCM 3617 / NBRC 0987 / NRRL Y-1542) TaxID=983966 RepID=A0A0H5C030_CYBJN|nr:maltase [Cyberlindnera jadinii NRRL Y-1542]ODV76458.1 maltase [Cyberlindnera jadinii NRRL Y-1542]CEP21088.1 AGL1 [Cyberlindnera jadinii]